ncbi:MAG: aminotransferase class I/II-fold pyridoxal phosphate-dependent enzyme [Bifidobacterium minimum]|jgi:aminotransferase|nr:aminotransferase class I/II-fold pyridoxal phosphate-dependent enzyme [Bifidobacterium minimum]
MGIEQSHGSSWYESRINPAVSGMKGSPIRAFDQRVSSIPRILRLTLGEPDFPTPEHIKVAAERSLAANRTHYSPSPGTPGLRAAIRDYLARRRGLRYDVSQIIVTEGAYEALSSVLRTLLQPGAGLIVPSPSFGLYRSLAYVNGAELVEVDTEPTGFRLTPGALQTAVERMRDSPRVVILLNSPCNPTGVAYTREELEGFADVVRGSEALVVSDEVYSEIVFDAPHASLAGILPERTVLVDSASKSYAMTGWRVGYFAAPRPLVPALSRAHQTAVGSVSTIAMDAAQEAFENGDADIEAMSAEYRSRRDHLTAWMREAGFDFVHPQGAFYLYARIPEGFAGTSTRFALDLAEKARVAVIPGDAFDARGSRYFRISYAASLDMLHEAVRRIHGCLDAVVSGGSTDRDENDGKDDEK